MNKPSYKSYLRSFIDIDGTHVCYDKKKEVMFKEKNYRRNRVLFSFGFIVILAFAVILRILGIELRLLLIILNICFALGLVITFLRYFFVDFIRIYSIEEARDTEISNFQRFLNIPFWGLLIVLIFS